MSAKEKPIIWFGMFCFDCVLLFGANIIIEKELFWSQVHGTILWFIWNNPSIVSGLTTWVCHLSVFSKNIIFMNENHIRKLYHVLLSLSGCFFGKSKKYTLWQLLFKFLCFFLKPCLMVCEDEYFPYHLCPLMYIGNLNLLISGLFCESVIFGVEYSW